MIRRKLTLEERVARLEKAIKNEKWQPDFKKADEIFKEILANDEINPEGYTIRDFDRKAEMINGGVYYKSAKNMLNTDSPELMKILAKYRTAPKTDFKFSDFAAQQRNSGFYSPGTDLCIVVFTNKSTPRKQYVSRSDDDMHDDPNYRDMQKSADWLKWQHEPGSSTWGK